MKQISINISLIIISLCITFGVLELACHLGIINNSKNTIYKNQAHTLSKGAHTVMLLGDSFTLEEDNWYWPSRLREFLRSNRINMVNLSKSGSSVNYHLKMLTEYGERFKPKLIILNYYVGNDLTDIQYRQKSIFKKTVNNILGKTYFGQYLLDIHGRMRTQMRLKEVRALSSDKMIESNPLNPLMIDMANRHPRYFMDNLLVDTTKNKEAWEKIKKIILRIDKEAKRLNSILLITAFPSCSQINESRNQFFEGMGFEMDTRFQTVAKPQENFKAFSSKYGLNYFDLLPHFKKAPMTEYCLGRDTHWNTNGHRLAFELIKKEVNELLRSNRVL